MLCGVTATLGSNPSATATAARPQWGRAVLLCLNGVWARARACVCVLGPGCLVCPWAAGYLADGVPVGGGPPASRPRRELRSARRLEARPGPAAWPSGTLHTGGACVAVCGWVRRLEARPGPAAAHGPRSLAPQPSGPVGTLHTGGACVAVTSPARPYRMGTAAWVSGLSTQWRPVADADWCVGSKRARALRALRRPPHRRRLCRCVWLGASPRSPARPRRRPRAPQSTGSTAWPSRSCGALHAGRANPLRGR